MSPNRSDGLFTLGVSPEQYHLPHPRLALPVILLIRRSQLSRHLAGLTSTSTFISTGPSSPTDTVSQALESTSTGTTSKVSPPAVALASFPARTAAAMDSGTLPVTALELLGEGVERRGAVRGAPDAGREDDAALFAGLAQQRLHVRRVARARRLQRAREHAEIHGAGDAHLRFRRLVRLRVDRRRPSIALELGAGLLERLFERPGGGRERRDEDQRKRYEENPSHDATSTPDSG
jgi:hypothetical protein